MPDALAILQRLKKLSEKARAWQGFPSSAISQGSGHSELLRRLTDIQVALLDLCLKHGLTSKERKRALEADKKYEVILLKLHELMEWLQEQRGRAQDSLIQEKITTFVQGLVDVQMRLLKLKQSLAQQSENKLPLAPNEELCSSGGELLDQEESTLPKKMQIPDAPLAGVAYVTKALPTPLPLSPSPKKTLGKIREKLSRLGMDALGISICVHIILVIITLTWVVARHVTTPQAEETYIVTGAGGGNDGRRQTTGDGKFQQKQPRPMAKIPQRIAVRGQSTISMPDLSDIQINMFDSNGLCSSPSKGLGGGAGGGIGNGIGLGIGNGRNLVSSFMPKKRVMGLDIEAENIAVYLDSSGSMLPYLENVRQQIYKEYPHADIFEHKHIGIKVQNGKVLGGLNSTHAPTHSRARKIDRANTAPIGKQRPLSAQGKAILKRYGPNFAKHSVGAWMDIMMFEDYDALVVFSDFQDGVRDDGKKATWEKRWTTQFSKKRPKLYLFSIQLSPQLIWQKCVEVSGGEIKMMPELGRRRRSKPTVIVSESTTPKPKPKPTQADTPKQSTR
ncbi:MAG: hypothetical protein LBD01_07110 [Puniceicoccales bacterium]|jgi:hypothetical protein|nr:hypothetical protein [Puniceicoccales bacterium]